MDSRVTARFFRVSPQPRNAPDFPDLLLATMEREQPCDRERNLDDGVTVRLERCESEGDFIKGEFCRKQTVNIPPGAGPAGLSPIVLEDGHGLGHVAAFRYHLPTRALLLQHNPQCVSPNRICSYISAGNAAALFTLTPVLRRDAWDRFADRRVRKIEVGFSSPDNLDVLDREGIAAARGAKMLAEAYEGVAVTITIGVGRNRKKFLNSNKIANLVSKLVGSAADVETIKVKAENVEEPINFLEEHMKVSRVLTLPEGNPSDHFQIRNSFLTEEFSANLPYLEGLYRRAVHGSAD